MLLFQLVLSPGLLADTTHKAKISEKLTALSHLSGEEVFGMIIKGAMDISLRILIAAVIFFVGRWAIHYIRSLVRKILDKRGAEASLRTFLVSLISITLNLFLITVIIGVLGIDTSSFIALFASAGLAIGMALSGTLQNFAGGVMILSFKPFKVGDFIETQGQTGTVKEIQLFNTVINTPDNKTIMIPNGGISTGIINNYSKEHVRRVEWTFGIAYGDNYDFAKATLLELIRNDSRINPEPAPMIALSKLADSSVNIVVRAWTKTEDFWNVYFDLNEKVYQRFAEVGLNIPFPQMDVHLHESKPDN